MATQNLLQLLPVGERSLNGGGSPVASVIPYLLGPELYWVLTYSVVRVATKRNLAPDPRITESLDHYWRVLPMMVVPLTFAFFFSPVGGRWWLLLRIDLAIAVGLAFAAMHYVESMTYHEPSSGPGAGTAGFLMLSFGYMLMALGTAVAAVVIWWRSRAAG